MNRLAVSAIKVAVDDGSADGLLVLNDSMLVAVLVCLDDAIYGVNKGRWYLEAGFGPCAVSAIIYDDSETALRWIAGRLNLDEESVTAALTSISASS